MKLGLDIAQYAELTSEERSAVADWVTDHNIPRAVRYEITGEGFIDALVILDPLVALRWCDHGATAVLIWRRRLRILEVPPVIKELPEMG